MRYLFYIIIFMLLLTAGVITLTARDGKQPPGDYIAKVNDRYILKSDLTKGRNVSLDSHDIKYEFINSLITKEVLIHEAMERKIDQEEAFRQSIKNFYEQSLVKTLLDRQLEKPPPQADRGGHFRVPESPQQKGEDPLTASQRFFSRKQ